jgi:hypothetical protein
MMTARQIDREERRVARSDGADFARDNSCISFDASDEVRGAIEALLLAMIREVSAILYMSGSVS